MVGLLLQCERKIFGPGERVMVLARLYLHQRMSVIGRLRINCGRMRQSIFRCLVGWLFERKIAGLTAGLFERRIAGLIAGLIERRIALFESVMVVFQFQCSIERIFVPVIYLKLS